MISIAMTTYNGKEYIDLQLKSILSQTMIPNEIVIVDDCSTDNTFEIIEKYKLQYPNIRWILEKNEKNLGWKKNFAKAICMTHGDIIFLSDQDDYWCRDKIEVMVETLSNNDKIKVLAATYQTLDRNSFTLDYSNTMRNRGNKDVSLYKFDKNFYMIHYPGCNIAIRKEMKQWFESEYWNALQPHDEYIWTIGELFEIAFVLDYKVLYYLRHKNAATAKKRYSRLERIRVLEDKLYCINTIEKIISNYKVPNKKEKQNFVFKAKQFIVDRIDFLEKKKLKLVLKLFFNIKQYEKIAFFIIDIYCAWFR